jgi:hypothetical protein
MKKIQREDLCALARLKSDRVMAALAREMSMRDKLSKTIDALHDSVREARFYAAEDALFGSNVSKIESFCALHTKRLQLDLQRCDMRILGLRANAAREFGRVTVLEKILKTSI